jgi:hypothetical protein
MKEGNMSAKEDNLNLYAEYNKTLRAWLVGFGFGVPAMFIINEAAQRRLIESANAKCIIWLFLVGAASQVLMALLNKIVSWCAYHRYDKGKSKVNAVVRLFASLENTFIIDVVFDILSMVTFGWSIVLIARLFV